MSQNPTETESAPATVALRWLVQVRWVAIVGQLMAILVARTFMELPTLSLLGLTFLSAASNLLAPRMGAVLRFPGILLLLDTLLLTGLLFLTGGVVNPFSVFYLVYIALAAVVLSARWTAALSVFAILSYGILFIVGLGSVEQHHGFTTHLRGMWVAFVLSAGLVAFFVIRLRRTIEQRDRELQAETARAIRNEKLAALVTLAAGAAHELATPLATIAVVAGDLGLEAAAADRTRFAADVALIRAEVDRCRAILDDMAAGSGEAPGEKAQSQPAMVIVEACQQLLGPEEASRLVVSVVDPRLRVLAPPRVSAKCLSNLVRNALDASDAGERVDVEVRSNRDSVDFVVRDHGKGMSADDLARAGEPFWTTKAPGRGMGLGLFLVRTTLEQIGGRFDLRSSAGRGSIATMSLPAPTAP